MERPPRLKKAAAVQTAVGKTQTNSAASYSNSVSAGVRRLNFNVSEKAYNELNSLAKSTRRSMTEIVRLGVGLAKIVLEAEGQGGRLIITNSQGDPVKEIVLPG